MVLVNAGEPIRSRMPTTSRMNVRAVRVATRARFNCYWPQGLGVTTEYTRCGREQQKRILMIRDPKDPRLTRPSRHSYRRHGNGKRMDPWLRVAVVAQGSPISAPGHGRHVLSNMRHGGEQSCRLFCFRCCVFAVLSLPPRIPSTLVSQPP